MPLAQLNAYAVVQAQDGRLQPQAFREVAGGAAVKKRYLLDILIRPLLTEKAVGLGADE